ncbi:hypothetical protein KM043_013420 [Ampulex compressa]|nr:hypothetical protein KM043_013420 [Ampulex compressa]
MFYAWTLRYASYQVHPDRFSRARRTPLLCKGRPNVAVRSLEVTEGTLEVEKILEISGRAPKQNGVLCGFGATSKWPFKDRDGRPAFPSIVSFPESCQVTHGLMCKTDK